MPSRINKFFLFEKQRPIAKTNRNDDQHHKLRAPRTQYSKNNNERKAKNHHYIPPPLFKRTQEIMNLNVLLFFLKKYTRTTLNK